MLRRVDGYSKSSKTCRGEAVTSFLSGNGVRTEMGAESSLALVAGIWIYRIVLSVLCMLDGGWSMLQTGPTRESTFGFAIGGSRYWKSAMPIPNPNYRDTAYIDRIVRAIQFLVSSDSGVRKNVGTARSREGPSFTSRLFTQSSSPGPARSTSQRSKETAHCSFPSESFIFPCIPRPPNICEPAKYI